MRPKKLVIIGDPISQSLSPKFQNAALRAAKIDIDYKAVRVAAEALEPVARELAAEDTAGNVTVPHKITFARLCARLSPIAERVGAVNTFLTENGALTGDNTDVGGFDAAARSLLGKEPADLRIALIGAGGSAAAVLGAVERWPEATVHLYSRRAEQAASLAARFGDFVRVESTPRSALRSANLVVNATPIGMRDDEIPFDVSLLPPDAAVLDLVYRSGGTTLVRAALGSGLRAADGTTMLVEQGALSFRRWFGFDPDKTVMRAALD